MPNSEIVDTQVLMKGFNVEPLSNWRNIDENQCMSPVFNVDEFFGDSKSLLIILFWSFLLKLLYPNDFYIFFRHCLL